MYQSILVPVDSSPCSAMASRHALDLSKLLGSRVTFAHVLDEASSTESARAAAQALLEQLSMGARIAPRLRITEARGRGVPETIIALADEEEAELIVMGTHGREGAELLRLGSVARAVASRTHLPLVIIPLKVTIREPFGERLLKASRALEEPVSPSSSEPREAPS
jgi:nucleotide-binding universal stress UspA family protein